MAIELLKGAFTAELVKGKNGKKKWQYTAVTVKLEKKKGTLKERPQYPIIEQYEKQSGDNFKDNLKTTVLDITKFLKTLVK